MQADYYFCSTTALSQLSSVRAHSTLLADLLEMTSFSIIIFPFFLDKTISCKERPEGEEE